MPRHAARSAQRVAMRTASAAILLLADAGDAMLCCAARCAATRFYADKRVERAAPSLR